MQKIFWNKKSISFITMMSMVMSLCIPLISYPIVTNAATLTGPNNAGTFVNDTTVGTIDWTDVESAEISDNHRAEVDLNDFEVSRYLKATNFNFSIPDGATIEGILVDVEKKAAGTDRIKDNSIKIVKNNSIVGGDKAALDFWASNDTSVSYGGATDVWGESFTSADINSPDFGVVFSAKKDTSQGSSVVAGIDHIQVTVYYTENTLPGSIVVTKNAVGGDGMFTFTRTGDEGVLEISTVDGTGDATINDLEPGNYTVTEVVPDGWEKTDDTCTDVSVSAGATATCTITNSKLPTLTVDATVANDNGGTKESTDFVLQIDGSQVTDKTSTMVSIGAHTASIDALFGYTASNWGGDCASDGTITLAAGENKTCTVVIEDISPTLNVIKSVINDDGGTHTASDFTMDVSGPTPLSFSGAENPGVTNDVNAGSYMVTETGPEGYALSYLGNCAEDGNFSIDVGEHKNCTLTNDDKSPHLTVEVIVVNDAGGTLASGEVGVHVVGINVLPTDTFDGDEEGFTVSLNANEDYSVAAGDVSGYTQTISPECSSDTSSVLDLDQRRVCTITFDDIEPTLTVTTVVVNDDAGTNVVSDFPLFVGAVSVESGVQTGFDAGAYTVSQTPQTGYLSVIGGDCDAQGNVTLSLGDNKSCVITNDDEPEAERIIPATLSIVKVVVNDNGGTKTNQDFSFKVNDGVSTSFESDGQNDLTVDAGTYTITESATAGYALTFENCTSISIENGDTKTCTITSNDIQPTLTVTTVVVNDNGGTKVISDFPLFVGAVSVSSGVSAGFDAGGYVVSETVQTGYAKVVGGDCSSTGAVTLNIGDEKSCTITNNDNAPAIVSNGGGNGNSGGGGGGGGVVLNNFNQNNPNTDNPNTPSVLSDTSSTPSQSTEPENLTFQTTISDNTASGGGAIAQNTPGAVVDEEVIVASAEEDLTDDTNLAELSVAAAGASGFELPAKFFWWILLLFIALSGLGWWLYRRRSNSK